MVKSNNPILLTENRGSLQLTEDSARGVFNFMNWVKRKGTTGKNEWPQQFLLEEKLTFLEKISGAIFYHDVPKELFYLSPGK